MSMSKDNGQNHAKVKPMLRMGIKATKMASVQK